MKLPEAIEDAIQTYRYLDGEVWTLDVDQVRELIVDALDAERLEIRVDLYNEGMDGAAEEVLKRIGRERRG